MKNSLLAVALLSLPTWVLAHPGHGKPGFIHAHEWANLFADGTLIVGGILALGIVCWRFLKR